ncbi:RAB interacting factor, isoform CRA_a [Mus musculus]|nr:RAB interacting factor, isoform CRA_a [Mus musculus]
MEPCELQNELVSAEGRNRKAVLCQRCGSRVLQPGTALFSRRQGWDHTTPASLNESTENYSALPPLHEKEARSGRRQQS